MASKSERIFSLFCLSTVRHSLSVCRMLSNPQITTTVAAGKVRRAVLTDCSLQRRGEIHPAESAGWGGGPLCAGRRFRPSGSVRGKQERKRMKKSARSVRNDVHVWRCFTARLKPCPDEKQELPRRL